MRILISLICVVFLYSGSLYSQCMNVYNCWENQFQGAGNGKDIFYDIEVSKTTNNVYTTGETFTAGGANADYITIKYNPDGVILWTRIYDGPGSGNDIAYSIAIDDSDNVYITGESKGAGSEGQDYATIKYNSNGDLKWVNRYSGPSGNADQAYSIVLDASRNVYVTGNSHQGGSTNQDFTTIKYNSNGTQLWIKINDYGAADFAKKVILDNSKNVYVTGYNAGANGTAHDFRTTKYDSNGVVKWSRSFNYPANSHDEPNDIAVDNLGNVYVTGYSVGFFGNQYAIIKYNSAGDSVWHNNYLYVGALHEAKAILLDSVGNVYITGSSSNGSNMDIATVKYNSVTGVQMWAKRYNGTGNGRDEGTSIVQGKNGKIFVGGGSKGNLTGDDFVIIEYDMTTGDSCFVSRIAAPTNETINAMTIDYDEGYIFACGSTGEGTGVTNAVSARYCLLGVVNSYFNITASLEGLYDSGTNKLRMKDNIKGYLRRTVSPYLLEDSSNTVLDSATLQMTCVFNNSPTGNYFIVIKHRNSIETWSRIGGEPFVCGTEMNYTFSNSLSKAYGGNMKLVDTSPNKYAFYTADVNQDGIVDITDGSLIDNDAFNFASGYIPTELNGDGFVDIDDALYADNNGFNFVSLVRP
ncbi:MAG TPA: SBBP repeat-containing protein [Ignavibacteria bacterium]|nr:SBBP repeat-containing protein [Ignavibacteria bacterium]